MLDLAFNSNLSRVQPELLARAVARLEEVNDSLTNMKEDQLTDIFMDICDRDTPTLEQLNLSGNTNVSIVEPGLPAERSRNE